MNRIALNFQLPAIDQAAPEWLELVPAGRIQGRDGRAWLNDQPAQVLAHNHALNRDVVIDIEHASELRAPRGEEAPAAGWITELQIRDGAIWGRADWTARGRALILNREYRYYSPAFLYDSEGRVRGIASVGLTNKHNLDLPALNHQTTEDSMSVAAAIRQALGLKDDANEADVVLAIGNMKTALNSAQQPSLEKFVPRAEFDALQQKHDTLQTALNTQQTTQREAEITALVDGAIAEGKVTPPTRDFYLATCRQEGGIEQFKAFIAKAPQITAATNLDQRKPGDGEQLALNAEQAQIAAMFGNSAEDIQKYGK
jgi:phage I-like protein